jgi:hypothetical protein
VIVSINLVTKGYVQVQLVSRFIAVRASFWGAERLPPGVWPTARKYDSILLRL